jgi:hypothetical protein
MFSNRSSSLLAATSPPKKQCQLTRPTEQPKNDLCPHGRGHTVFTSIKVKKEFLKGVFCLLVVFNQEGKQCR